MLPVNLQDFIRQSQLFRTFRVDDLLFVEYRCLVEDRQSDIWTHDNYFAYVLGGQKRWKTKDRDCLVASGDALFVRRGANTVYQYFDEPFFVLFIFVPDRFIRQVLTRHPDLEAGKVENYSPADTLFPLALDEVLRSYFQSLFSYFLQSHPPHPALLKLKLEELVLNILSRSGNEAIRQCFRGMARRQKADLEEVMRRHYTYPLSLSDYARLCARSLSTFRRDFKAVFHTTPAKWLIRERLAFSRFLLETTDQIISEIAENSGFKNRSHFTKLFKETFGMTPVQFRERRVEQAPTLTR